MSHVYEILDITPPQQAKERQRYYAQAQLNLMKYTESRVQHGFAVLRPRTHSATGYADQIPPLCQNLSRLATTAEKSLPIEPTQGSIWFRMPTDKRKPGQPGIEANIYNELSLLAQYGVKELLYFLSTQLEQLLDEKRYQDMLDILVRQPCMNKKPIGYCCHSSPFPYLVTV